MNDSRLSIIRKTAFFLAVLLVGTGYYLWTSSAGDMYDDVLYSHCFEIPTHPDDTEYDFYSVTGKRISSISDVVRSARNHYLYWDNGRLANTVMFAMEPMPLTPVHLMCTFAFLAMVLLMLRTGAGRMRALLFVAVTVGVFLTFPSNALYKSVDFQINYVWTSVVILLFWMLCNRWYSGASVWQTVALVLLAIPAGSMHEGFSVPAVIGFCLAGFERIRRGEKPGKGVVCALAVMLLFTLAITFAPSVINRAGREVVGGGNVWGGIRRVLTGYWIIPLTLILVVITTLRRGGRKSLIQFCRRNIFSLSMIFCASAISAIAVSERSIWPASMFALILLMRLYAKREERVESVKRAVWGNVAAVALSALLCSYLIGLGKIQKAMFAEHERLMAASMRSEGNLFYSDLLNANDVPFWYGLAPLGIDTNLGIRAMVFSASKHRQRPYWEENLIVLPLRFAGMPLDSLPLIPGNAGLRGAFPMYYSPVRYFPKPQEQRSFLVTVGPPDYTVPYSFNPLRRLLELPAIIRGEGDSVVLDAAVIPMALEVTEGMRRRGTAKGDSVWFYHLETIPRELGRPILRIDTLP